MALIPSAALFLIIPGCQKPDLRAGVDDMRYIFSLDMGPDATAGFVCIAHVTDQVGRGTLTTRPFRVMPGKDAREVFEDAGTGLRFEAHVRVDASGLRATYKARLEQKGQSTIVFEATRDIPKA